MRNKIVTNYYISELEKLVWQKSYQWFKTLKSINEGSPTLFSNSITLNEKYPRYWNVNVAIETAVCSKFLKTPNCIAVVFFKSDALCFPTNNFHQNSYPNQKIFHFCVCAADILCYRLASCKLFTCSQSAASTNQLSHSWPCMANQRTCGNDCSVNYI
jgi:hypothetical protein